MTITRAPDRTSPSSPTTRRSRAARLPTETMRITPNRPMRRRQFTAREPNTIRGLVSWSRDRERSRVRQGVLCDNGAAMNVVLIDLHPHSDPVTPISLANLAAVLRRHGHTTYLLSLSSGRPFCSGGAAAFPARETTSSCRLHRLPAELLSDQSDRTDGQGSLPGCRVIIGGPQATFMPEEALAELPEFDFVCRGEGELVIRAVADAIEAGPIDKAVPGTSTRIDDGDWLRGDPARAARRSRRLPVTLARRRARPGRLGRGDHADLAGLSPSLRLLRHPGRLRTVHPRPLGGTSPRRHLGGRSPRPRATVVCRSQLLLRCRAGPTPSSTGSPAAVSRWRCGSRPGPTC